MKPAIGAALVLGIIGLGTAAVESSSAPAGNQRCTYLEGGGPGPADNKLRIQAQQFSELTLVRRGSRIRVLNASDRPIDCAGPANPTIRNVDAIETVWRGAQAYGPNIDLRGGPLAPGATAEADGTPEIEVEIKGAPQIGFFVIGSRGGDSVELGTFPDGTIGVNLNAAAESAADADVTMPPDGIFGAELFDGDDRLDASGGSLLPGSPAQVELFIRSMGANADEIVGGAQESAMVGGDGRDRIVGGAGPDRIAAGPGEDFVAVRGGGPDSVQCGADFDTYEADREDDLRLCERRAHPGA